MKILQYVPYFFDIHPGGLEKIALTLHNGIKNHSGLDALLVSSNIEKGSLELPFDRNISIELVSSIDLIAGFPVPKFWSKTFRENIHLIRVYKPDIIVTHTRFFIQSFVGGILAKCLGVKWIHIEHGSGFVKGYPWYVMFLSFIFDNTLGRWIFRFCDTIITISNQHTVFISRFTKKTPVVIYNPVQYLAHARVENDIVHIGYIGRLVKLKGVDLLVRALEQIKERKWQCTIIGDGKEKKHLEVLVTELGLEDRIIFVGSDDRSNRLHKIDILVNPSYQEGVPTTVIEGLIAGCYCIATNVGGTSEISKNEDLKLITPGNKNLLTSALIKGLEEYKKYRGSSSGEVKEKFDPHKILLQYTEIFSQ